MYMYMCRVEGHGGHGVQARLAGLMEYVVFVQRHVK